MTSEPVRLLEDPSATSALRGDLVHAVEAEVHGLDFAAGLAALQKATATVTSSTTVVAGTSLLAKLGIGAGVAAGAVVLWLGLGGGRGPQAPDERVAAPVVTSATTLADERVEPERAPLRVEATPAQPAPEKAGAGEPERVEPAEPELTQPEPEPDPEAGEPKPASVPRRKGAAGARPSGEKTGDPSAKPSADDDGVLREAKLVARARSNLARDPAQALASTEEAEREFPRGQLVEERRAIAIRALVALGRLDEAKARAESFLAEHGRGAHAAAVRRALEEAAKGSPAVAP
jgi:hypothetical protein